MRFATKIWLSTALAMMLCVVVVACVTYQTSKAALREQYLERYDSVLQSIAGTLFQVEAAIDLALVNALQVYATRDALGEELDDESLQQLADALGVHALGYFDANTGLIEKISGWPEGRGSLNFYDLCPSYRGFYEREHPPVTTPFSTNIVPTALGYDTEKYVYMASSDRQRILGVSLRSRRMMDFLHEAIRSDPHTLSLAMYAPNGQELALVSGPNKEPSEQSMPSFHEHEGISLFEDRAILTLFSTPSVPECCECAQKGLVSQASEYRYRLSMTVSTVPLQTWIQGARRRALGFALLGCVGALVLTRLLADQLVRRLAAMSGVAREVVRTRDLSLQVAERPGGDEVNDLAIAFNAMLRDIRAGDAARVEAHSAHAIAKVASQVAHDIRSPLAALNVALADLGQPSEETRLLVRNAIYRIQDIANHLLLSRKEHTEGEKRSARSILMSSLVESVVSEKRTQYRARLGLTIEASFGDGAFGAFIEADRTAFMRVLSNLINNAVEAIEKSGRVVVHAQRVAGSAELQISDTGRGMAPDQLEHLGRIERTSKQDGNGLGVSHAYSTIEEWGGSIAFSSAPKVGTTVTVRLPAAAPPLWFCGSISMHGIREVVVVDDDLSIHGLWDERGRLGALGEAKIIHLSTPDALREFVGKHPALAQCLFLVDQEFLGFHETGLQLVVSLGIAARSVLVTSRADEDEILAACEAERLKVLPKALAAMVPVRNSKSTSRADAVLIDDDQLVRYAWDLTARVQGVVLHTFEDPGDFLAVAGRYEKTLPIYVDVNLGGDLKGTEISRSLSKQGFSRLYLATGDSPAAFGPMPWVRAVVGKDCPF